jgi:hypothetical protein
MFTLFHEPYYYRPTYWYQAPRYSSRQSAFERYLDALDQRFFGLLRDDAAELLRLESQKPGEKSDGIQTSQSNESKPSTDSVPAPTSAPAPAPASESESESSAVPKTDSKPSETTQQPVHQRPVFGRQYVSHTRTAFNGQDYVEEHREKVTGSDGETRIATRRRLGDRWYENEVVIDKDGKKNERETWHNVGDDDIETFKLEWGEKQSGKAALKSSTPKSTPDASAIESQTETNPSPA